MTINHLVLIGGGHSNTLLMRRWLMNQKLMPKLPITIISRDSYLVYSSLFPSVIAKLISIKDSLIDIGALANSVKISFIKDEVDNISFQQKIIFLKNRPSIEYSKLILNCGINTKISKEFQDLVNNKIACPIKPFFQSYRFITSEDQYNSYNELPFVIVGSGLAAIELAFALRKRWNNRNLILISNLNKVSRRFLYRLKKYNIQVTPKIDFEYRKILLCTGNEPQLWIKNNILKLDNKGRVITNFDLRVKSFKEIYAVGDCAYSGFDNKKSSGILAVKASKTLAKNLINDLKLKSLKKWYPPKNGLQLLNTFNEKDQKAFAIYGKLIFGPSKFFWYLKNKIDKRFINNLNPPIMNIKIENSIDQEFDCRGCASKISQHVLNNSLRNISLDKFADYPEDACEIFRSNKTVIFQSIDGFPALISDPWLNGKITTLHACSDLWASGCTVSSAQILISLPKVDNEFQRFLFTQSVEGVKSVIEGLKGEVLGGHTFESRNIAHKPYSLGIDISLSVQGILNTGSPPWKKYGMQPGDVLLMSRPLGIGIFFAAKMRNFNLFHSYDEIFKNIITSQQPIVNEIHLLQDKLGENLINAATDITGYGFLGHLNEMILTTNLERIKNNLTEIKVSLDLLAFKAYPGIFDLIRKGIRSSLFFDNKKVYDQINLVNDKEKNIFFFNEGKITKDIFLERIELLLDPQTCGPLLISCNPIYEKYFTGSWYKVGSVSEKN